MILPCAAALAYAASERTPIVKFLAAASPRSPLLRQRAANETREIDAVCRQHAQRTALVALQEREPTGVAALLALTGPPKQYTT